MRQPLDERRADHGDPRVRGEAIGAVLGGVDPTAPDYWRDTDGVLAALREGWLVVRSTAGGTAFLSTRRVAALPARFRVGRKAP